MSTNLNHGKLIWNTMISLDGFVAGADGDMSWAFGHDSLLGTSVADLVSRIGGLLVGRRTMDVEDRDQPGFYGGDYTGPFFVLTSDTDRTAPEVNGVLGTLVNGSIKDVVMRVLNAANGRDVVVLGGTVARACLEADLIDEIVLFVAPILLGDGVRLYEGDQRRLDLVEATRDGDLTVLTLAPRESGRQRVAISGRAAEVAAEQGSL